MSFVLTRLQILSMWIELERNYALSLVANKDYFNFSELNRQMLLTLLFCKQQQEMILSMREVEQINNLLPTITCASKIEKMVMRRIELSDLILAHITPPDYFPYSLDEILSYIDKIELHQKMLNVPF
jgi:hypothetical protein